MTKEHDVTKNKSPEKRADTAEPFGLCVTSLPTQHNGIICK